MMASGSLKFLRKEVAPAGAMKTPVAAVTGLILEGHTSQSPELTKWELPVWYLHFKPAVCEVLMGMKSSWYYNDQIKIHNLLMKVMYLCTFWTF